MLEVHEYSWKMRPPTPRIMQDIILRLEDASPNSQNHARYHTTVGRCVPQLPESCKISYYGWKMRPPTPRIMQDTILRLEDASPNSQNHARYHTTVGRCVPQLPESCKIPYYGWKMRPPTPRIMQDTILRLEDASPNSQNHARYHTTVTVRRISLDMLELSLFIKYSAQNIHTHINIFIDMFTAF